MIDAQIAIGFIVGLVALLVALGLVHDWLVGRFNAYERHLSEMQDLGGGRG